MRFSFFLLISLLAGFYLTGCTSDSTPEFYTISTNINPEGAGEVIPPTTKLEEGRSQLLRAVAKEGWIFVDWSGDLTGDKNPASVILDQDYIITANFEDISSLYSVNMSISDYSDILELEFGQDSNPSLHNEAIPPSPPGDTFHAYFNVGQTKYWKYYESFGKINVKWELHINPGSSENIELNWHIDSEKMNGNLTLTDNSETWFIDMLETKSVIISIEEKSPLLISYEVL